MKNSHVCVQAHPSILPRRSSRRGLRARGVVAFLGATCRQQPSPHPHARSSLFVLRHGRHSYVSGLQECPHAAPLEAGLSRPLLFVSTSPAASGQHTRQNRQRSDRTCRHNIELPHARGVCRLKKKTKGGPRSNAQWHRHDPGSVAIASWSYVSGLQETMSACSRTEAELQTTTFFFRIIRTASAETSRRDAAGASGCSPAVVALLRSRSTGATVCGGNIHSTSVAPQKQAVLDTTRHGFVDGRRRVRGVSGSRFAFWMHAAQPTSLKFCPHGGLRSKAVITAAATKPLPGRYM